MADSTNTAYVVPDVASRARADAVAPHTTQAAYQASPPAVEVAGVAHRLGHRWALRGVTLRVEPGQTVAVVGANGSGKTTLLRILATTLTPTRGSARVFGHDLVTEVDAVRGITAMLGHATGLYDDLSAAENLRFALEMSGSSPSTAAVHDALRAVGMDGHAGEPVRTLSSGMRRRVALARVMLRRPKLLLLDEPYNSFDEAGVGLVHAFVRETAAAGGAALVVTHDLERRREARFDGVVTLHAGRVLEGAPALLEAET